MKVRGAGYVEMLRAPHDAGPGALDRGLWTRREDSAMRKHLIGGLALGLALAAGPAWALSDADTGGQWLQAPMPQKIAVANILSRQFGGDPMAYVQCLDQTFAGGANASMTIRDAAQQCQPKQ
jgi:hypothetical protein